jgi:hypothetical protein
VSKRDWWLAAVAALAASAALGQAAAPAAQPAKPKEDPAAAEAAAAMERARRQAANPMRIILEAAKAKRRPGEDTPAVTPEPASVRPVANRSAAPTSTVASTAATATPAVVTSPAPEPRVAAAPPAPEPAQATLTSSTLQNKSAAPVAALVGTGGTNSSTIAPVPEPLPVLPNAPGRPKLLKMVEPDVPQRVLDEMGRNATVAVDLTIRTDGSVGKVALASPAPRQMNRLLSAAMEQWRFDTAATERNHRVELVFNADR